MAMTPTGPHPVTRTLRPATAGVAAVWTALPKFSCSEAMERGIPGGSGQQFTSGTATKSANTPSRWTPRMRVCRQRWPLPVRHRTQVPQTTWDSTDTSVPNGGPVTSSPWPTTTPHISWPTTTGGVIRSAAQGSQLRMWRSVPQIDAAFTCRSTSPRPGRGAGISRI